MNIYQVPGSWYRAKRARFCYYYSSIRINSISACFTLGGNLNEITNYCGHVYVDSRVYVKNIPLCP